MYYSLEIRIENISFFLILSHFNLVHILHDITYSLHNKYGIHYWYHVRQCVLFFKYNLRRVHINVQFKN